MKKVPDSVLDAMAKAAYDRFHLRLRRPTWDDAPTKTKTAFRTDTLAIVEAAAARGYVLVPK